MRQILSALILGLMFLMPSAWAQTVYQVGTTFTMPNKGTVVYATNAGTKEAVLQKGTYECKHVPNITPPPIVNTCTVYSTHLINVNQNRTMTAAYPVKVSFGARGNWVTKELPRGTHACNTTVFGSDPAPGVTKTCKEVHQFISCQPSQFAGDGSKGLFDRDAAGNCIAAWYCPGKEMPVLLVATAAKCNASTARTLFAQVLTNPSTTTLEELLAQNGMLMNAFTEPTLKAIWVPYTEKIIALQATLPK